MEYLGEIIALGIDSIIFGICLKQYVHCRNAVLAIRGAEFHEVGEHLNTLLDQSGDNKVGYIAIRGIVKPLGEPLHSVNDKYITGVIQKLSVKEHVVARTTTGFWLDQERVVQNAYNSVPFVLQRGMHKIEVVDAMAAEILDMDVVSDYFEPSTPSIVDHLWGFFAGVRQRGLQSTETMLREGAIITGVGQLSKSMDKSDSIKLQPPSNGAPFYLTSISIDSLIRKLDDRRRTYRWLCLVFGAIGLVIGGIVARRYWKDKEEQRIAEELQQSVIAARTKRRQNVRASDLRENQLCIVCRTNSLEIILLPCGHVCLCKDCSDKFREICPVCRTPIRQRHVAYVS